MTAQYLENSAFTKSAPIVVRSLTRRGIKIRPYELRRCMASKKYAQQTFPLIPDSKWENLLQLLKERCDSPQKASFYEKWEKNRQGVDLRNMED